MRSLKTSTKFIQLAAISVPYRPRRLVSNLEEPVEVTPVEISSAPKTEVAGLLERGEQLLSEMDRQHYRLCKAAEGALKPDPPAWRNVRAAKTDYDAAYAELIQLSKQLNRMVQ
jgi:hypothetical protein